MLTRAIIIGIPGGLAAITGIIYIPDPTVRPILAAAGASIGVCILGINEVAKHGTGPEGSTEEA
jgi:hypothetical protein